MSSPVVLKSFSDVIKSGLIITPVVSHEQKWGDICDDDADIVNDSTATPSYQASPYERRGRYQHNILQDDLPDIYRDNSYIKCVDIEESTGLHLFAHTACTNEDTSITKQCRGNVYKGKKLIAKSFDYVPEYSQEVFDTDVVHDDLSNYVCFPAYEGTLVRVFCFEGVWKISTHKRLNAFSSKWCGKLSYGEIFINCVCKHFGYKVSEWEQFFDKLDNDKIYGFLLMSTDDNRIVVKGREYDMLHVGTFSRSDNFSLDIHNDIGVDHPDIIGVKSKADLVTYVSNVDITKTQGVFLVNKTTLSVIKILNKEYKQLYDIRGNEPSVKYRYLQIRHDSLMIDNIRKLYPSSVKWFDLYESVLNEASIDIFNAYATRYIIGDYINIPSKEYTIMITCRGVVEKNRGTLDLQTVVDIVNKQSPTNLNKIIKERCFNSTKTDCYKTPGRSFYYGTVPSKTGLFDRVNQPDE
jgi:hypothetical protein